MFKRIEIQLTGPICRCGEADLEWATKGVDGLLIRCVRCGTSLLVPHKEFVGRFRLDQPYLPYIKIEKRKTTPDVSDRGKVIAFPSPDGGDGDAA